MFWCCCGVSQPVVEEPIQYWSSGFTEYFIDDAGNRIPGNMRSTLFEAGATGRFGFGKRVSSTLPPGVASVTGQFTPSSHPTARPVSIGYGAMLVRIPANIGQPITSAVLRFQYNNTGGAVPPLHGVPVKGYLSRTAFNQVPSPSYQNWSELTPNPYPGINRRPWPDNVYGVTPTPYNDPLLFQWGVNLSPWVAGSFTGVCDNFTWSVDVTAVVQAYINVMPINNPIAYFFLHTEMSDTEYLSPTEQAAAGGFTIFGPHPSNYLQLTF